MSVLASLVQLVLIVCSVREAIIALPIDDTLGLQRHQELAEERRNLQQMLSGMNQLPYEMVDPDDHPYGEVEERSLRNHIPSRSRSPCKNFFWKTFSIC